MDDHVTSYAVCRRLARRAASSFYYSFHLRPRRKRGAMSAPYAFLRKTDDPADSDEPAEQRRAQLTTCCAARQKASIAD